MNENPEPFAELTLCDESEFSENQKKIQEEKGDENYHTFQPNQNDKDGHIELKLQSEVSTQRSQD